MIIAFDLDGTLIDSARDLGDAVSELMQSYGAPPLDLREAVAMVGDGAAMLVRRALARSGLEPSTPGALERYMQIIPEAICQQYHGKIINIHHSFLPSFVGANPYQRAYERGVKLIGATCHYATADLDSGPIIDQEVIRVEHFHTVDDLIRIGRDCERLALARSVRWHLSDRVLIHGNRSIVFRD